MRDWHGITHEVKILDRGVLYKRKRYCSLSEVARLITGDSWRASHARFQGLPSHRIALSARTKQTADVVAELSSQSSHRLRPSPVSREAFLHGVPEPAVLFLLGQPDAICGADREVKRGTLSLACSPNTDADRSKNSSASRPARTRRYAPCPTIGLGARPLMESARQSSSNRCSHAKSAE